MPGKFNKSGFSLFEVMVVLAIIGLMATIATPFIKQKDPMRERKELLAQLNALMGLAYNQALVTRKIHRVYCDFKNSMIRLEKATGKKNEKGEEQYSAVVAPYLRNSLAWPKKLLIKQFFLEGVDELDASQRRTTEVWFFVIPNGLTQSVVINAVDMQDNDRKRSQNVSFVLNPFTAQFTLYDEFKQP